MTYPHQKHVALSEKMQELKLRIEQLQQEQKLSLIDHINKKGRLVSLILEGIKKTFVLLGAALSSINEIPIVGFFVQMFATIPAAITTLTDKKSSLSSKILAITLLAVTTSLAITAFVIGGMTAAGIMLAFASIATVIEGISLAGEIINKYSSRKDYKEKKEFISLLKNRDLATLDSEAYKEHLEIRALQLEHLLNKPSHLPRASIQDELDFINEIRNKRGWDKLPFPEQSPQAELVTLYKEREELLLYMERIIKNIDKQDKKDLNNSSYITLVSDLQHQISEFDDKIDDIVKPLHKLKRNNLIANENVAKSVSNVALGGIGIIFGTLGVMALVGGIFMPPVVATVVLGFGIGLAAFGIIKWGVELYLDRQEKKSLKEHAKEHEETILEEALDCYEHELAGGYKHQGKCSYSTSLSRILTSRESTGEHLSPVLNVLEKEQTTSPTHLVASSTPEHSEPEAETLRLTGF